MLLTIMINQLLLGMNESCYVPNEILCHVNMKPITLVINLMILKKKKLLI